MSKKLKQSVALAQTFTGYVKELCSNNQMCFKDLILDWIDYIHLHCKCESIKRSLIMTKHLAQKSATTYPGHKQLCEVSSVINEMIDVYNAIADLIIDSHNNLWGLEEELFVEEFLLKTKLNQDFQQAQKLLIEMDKAEQIQSTDDFNDVWDMIQNNDSLIDLSFDESASNSFAKDFVINFIDENFTQCNL